MPIKRWTVVIEFERKSPFSKKKEKAMRSWTFLEALTAKQAIDKCTKQLMANEQRNSPKVIKATADLIKEYK